MNFQIFDQVKNQNLNTMNFNIRTHLSKFKMSTATTLNKRKILTRKGYHMY